MKAFIDIIIKQHNKTMNNKEFMKMLNAMDQVHTIDLSNKNFSCWTEFLNYQYELPDGSVVQIYKILDHIVHLNLDGNSLKTVENIAYMPHLMTLSMKNNLIRNISNWVTVLPKLQHIYLDGNPIQNFSPYYTNVLPSLKYLCLNGCYIQHYPEIYQTGDGCTICIKNQKKLLTKTETMKTEEQSNESKKTEKESTKTEEQSNESKKTESKKSQKSHEKILSDLLEGEIYYLETKLKEKRIELEKVQRINTIKVKMQKLQTELTELENDKS